MVATALPDSLGPYAVLLAIGFLVGWYGHGAKNNWIIAFGIVIILAAIGLLFGLIAMLPATDVLSSMLYDVGTYDPLTIAVVAALLCGVAALASFLPARRITKADPIEALRRL